MNFFARLSICALVGFGCTKAKDGADPSSATQVPAAAAPAPAPAPAPAVAAPPPSTPVAAGTEAASVPAGKPLAHYLDTAVAATVFEVKLNRGGGSAEKVKVQALDEAATKAYLGRLDLTQLPDGPVAKCPSDKVVELTDGGGKLLASIGFCQGKSASFSGPDGMMIGGIRATAP
jgi:pyruvate/2-oxoglutarate dehydrogenase complex dihydrolipoamide acyltransferase (E2) component